MALELHRALCLVSFMLGLVCFIYVFTLFEFSRLFFPKAHRNF